LGKLDQDAVGAAIAEFQIGHPHDLAEKRWREDISPKGSPGLSASSIRLASMGPDIIPTAKRREVSNYLKEVSFKFIQVRFMIIIANYIPSY
jgi:hypothetical protein